jgi:hypothetical protein
MLEERVGKDDIVMTTIQGFHALRFHLRLAPILDPTLAQKAARDIRVATPLKGPWKHTHNGVTYYFSRLVGMHVTPHSFQRALQELKSHYQLGSPRKIWLLRGGWELPLTPRCKTAFRGARVDLSVHRESNGLLFALKPGADHKRNRESEARSN